MRVVPAAVLAFRIAGQGLAERGRDPLAAAAGWALQDSPPGAAALALHARVEGLTAESLAQAVATDRTLLRIYNPRSAVSVIPSADAERFCAALLPPDAASLRHLVGRAVPDEAMPDEDAVALAVEAIGEALDGRALSRDELHEELRVRLPAELLPWCPGCGSHHARRGLLDAATLYGVLCHAGARDRQAAFARTDQWLGRPFTRTEPDAASAELVRRYLRGYGPSTPSTFAEWAGIGRSHARRAWALVEDELVPVQVDGRRASVLAADRDRLADPPPARGVRLLPAGDPLLQARDKEVLITDPDVRKRVWRVLGSPGLVLADGQPAGTWRPRKQGARLLVAIEPFGTVPAGVRDALETEAVAVAAHRGAATATVEVAEPG